MKTKSFNIGSTTGIMVLLIGCLGIISLIALNNLHLVKLIFKEGWPNFSVRYIIISTIICISTIVLFWSLIGSRRPELILSKSKGVSFERLSVFTVLFLSIIILFLFIYQPSTFYAISKEDGPIEWGSALLLFGSCFVTALSFLKNYRAIKNSIVTRVSLGLLSFTFFIIGMEEVSWFQRVLKIETLPLFKGNAQQEMNLHNFATDYIENIYYFGAFVFLVVFPFVRFLLPSVSSNSYLKIFIPRPFIGVIGSIACAYNFDMWNIIFIQITFFSSLVILCAFAVFSTVSNERYIILFTIILLVTTQILFLVNGVKLDRLWVITEYKEFFIPLVFFIYSVDLYIQLKRELPHFVR